MTTTITRKHVLRKVEKKNKIINKQKMSETVPKIDDTMASTKDTVPKIPKIEETPLPDSETETEAEGWLQLFPKFSENKKNRNRLLTISFLILTILFFQCGMVLFYLLFMILGIRSLFMSYPKEQSTMILYAYTVVFILCSIYSKNRRVLFINGVVWILVTVYLWRKQNRQRPSERLSRQRALVILTLVFGTMFVLFSIMIRRRKRTFCLPLPKQVKNIKKQKSSPSSKKTRQKNKTDNRSLSKK